jgi:hypothetical protein
MFQLDHSRMSVVSPWTASRSGEAIARIRGTGKLAGVLGKRKELLTESPAPTIVLAKMVLGLRTCADVNFLLFCNGHSISWSNSVVSTSASIRATANGR